MKNKVQLLVNCVLDFNFQLKYFFLVKVSKAIGDHFFYCIYGFIRCPLEEGACATLYTKFLITL